MTDLNLESTLLSHVVKLHGEVKALLPANLSIIDCHFLSRAVELTNPMRDLEVLSGSDPFSSEHVRLPDDTVESAYFFYNFDRDAEPEESAILNGKSGGYLYWDIHDRFIAVGGNDDFVGLALPYPSDIRKHFFVEASMYGGDTEAEARDIYETYVE